VRTLFDTSVLVAAMVETHSSHVLALTAVQAVIGGDETGIVSTHSLAELYSTLTRMPLRPRIDGPTAWRMIERTVTQHFDLVSLDAADYAEVLKRLSTEGLVGGIVYDAVIARAAEKADAERIWTLNAADFTRLPLPNSIAIEAPE
jgi:predicted nucleic acid-binding protein